MWIGVEFITLIKLSGHEWNLNMGCQRCQTGVYNPRQMHRFVSLDFSLIESTCFKFLLAIQFLGYFFTPEEAGDIDLLASHLASHKVHGNYTDFRCSCWASLKVKHAVSPSVCSPKSSWFSRGKDTFSSGWRENGGAGFKFQSGRRCGWKNRLYKKEMITDVSKVYVGEWFISLIFHKH